METGITSRFKNAWNAFLADARTPQYREVGVGSSYRPDRPRASFGRDRSIVTSVLNHIALDVAGIQIKHVRLDENGWFSEEINDGLNKCLTLSANIDQTGTEFIHDVVSSMMDEGCVAIVPVDTDTDPYRTGSYEILSLRTGKIKEWYPSHVRVEVYNERTGKKEDILVAKSAVAIIQNPMYDVMNRPNSTMQRLIRKLNLLDAVDEQSSSGKLDMIIQLPYTIKSEARRKQAEERRRDIETQLTGSKYGIAYTDGTEHITQLNRPVENNLMKQVEYLTDLLYSQLGITQSVMDGTADEKTMLNYYSRTITPILKAIVYEMKRKFLTQTALTQRQSIEFFRNPFELVPVNNIADIADKFTRNEILSSNEVRQIIGMKPSDDPRANELRNKNINAPATEQLPTSADPETLASEPSSDSADSFSPMTKNEFETASRELNTMDAQLDDLERELESPELKHYASPYYDPVKAHEYYMRNRELKRRRSTSSLNEEGKSTAKYVREQLDNERKQKVEEVKVGVDADIDRQRDHRKEANKQFRDATQRKIDSLRNELKQMTPEEKAEHREEFYETIGEYREEVADNRERLQAEYNASVRMIRKGFTEIKGTLKETYEEAYLQELDKIKADPKFRKPPKARKAKAKKAAKPKKSTGIIYY